MHALGKRLTTKKTNSYVSEVEVVDEGSTDESSHNEHTTKHDEHAAGHSLTQIARQRRCNTEWS